MRAVVGRIVHNGVVGDAELVELVQQLANMHVVLDHAVPIFILAGNTSKLVLYMGAEMHPRAVPPDEEGLALCMRAVDEVEGAGEGFLVDRLHTLLSERSGVLDVEHITSTTLLNHETDLPPVGKLDRVAQQVDQNLTQLAIVCSDRALFDPHIRAPDESFLLTAHRKHLGDLLRQVIEIEITGIQLHCACLDL